MPFYRLENFKKIQAVPHLSTGQGAVIEKEYLFFRRVYKEKASGSAPHYHPNEQFLFVLEGRINVLVGRVRRILSPGSLIHIPPHALHQNMATEEGQANYLYLKDRTWSLVGVAEDEALPDHVPTTEESRERLEKGDRSKKNKGSSGKTNARIDDLGQCFYDVVSSFDEPSRSGCLTFKVEGERMAFSYADMPAGYEIDFTTDQERFSYVLSGVLAATVDGESKTTGPGDIIYAPVGATVQMAVDGPDPVRLATIQTTNRLKKMLKQV